MNTDTYQATRAGLPAVASALLATTVVFVAAVLVLAGLFPANVLTYRGPVPLDLSILGHIVRDAAIGARCDLGLERLIGVGCRMEVISDAWLVIRQSPGAFVSTVVAMLAPVAAYLMTYWTISNPTPRRESLRGRSGLNAQRQRDRDLKRLREVGQHRGGRTQPDPVRQRSSEPTRVDVVEEAAWSDRRRPEPRIWVTGVLRGLAVGGAVVVLGLVVRFFAA